jgi:transcriptional regulator with XRE-family HTH domain
MGKVNDNIRAHRKQLSLTQDQFAQKIGIKRSLVGAYEEGRAEPRLELLQKMASLFNISVDELIGDASEHNVSERKYVRGKEVLVVTVDEHQKDNIELVPHWLPQWLCRHRICERAATVQAAIFKHGYLPGV